MQTLLIVLLAVAGVIAVAVLVFAIGSLYAVHAVLGKRKPSSGSANGTDADGEDKYGVRAEWFDEHKALTENFNITAFDGVRLGGMLVKHAEPSGNVAVVCHGYGVTARAVQPQAQLLYDNGFDVLLPSMRGHSGSDGKVGMAWLDRFDILRWVDMLVELYGKNVKIALAGVSMGGTSVIGACGMNPPPQVKCVIDDCGFSSQRDEFEETLKRRKRPSRLTLFMLNIGVKLFHGYSFYDADFVPLSEKITVPALFIHGDADTGVPVALGKKLFEACGSRDKRFAEFAGAGHALCYASDTDKYRSEVNKFLADHFGTEYKPEQPPTAEEAPTALQGDAAAESDGAQEPAAEVETK